MPKLAIGCSAALKKARISTSCTATPCRSTRTPSAQCNYGEAFTAAVQKDNFFGVQFHPERSGSAGGAAAEKLPGDVMIIPALDLIDGTVVRLHQGRLRPAARLWQRSAAAPAGLCRSGSGSPAPGRSDRGEGSGEAPDPAAEIAGRRG